MIGNDVVLSCVLSDFLTFLREVEASYTDNYDSMAAEDKITNDLLHLLELGELPCGERSKVATQLQYNRQNRRYYKDRVEELKPLYDYYTKNKAVFNNLAQVLGAIRKQESYHQNRTYKPRVIDISNVVQKQ